MEKRKLPFGAQSPADDKRFRSRPVEDSVPEGEIQAVEAEFYIEQHLVGWIIGRAGATLKEIEQVYQVKVSVDQSTKSQGYSSVLICGSAATVQAAAEHMNTSLARAAAASNPGDTGALGPFLLDSPPQRPVDDLVEELQVEQQLVGWLLGKGGAVVREIEHTTGCKISINQETRQHGYSRAQIHGIADHRAQARQLIQESLDRARSAGDGRDQLERQHGVDGCLVDDVLQIEQQWVGWLLGKSGGVVREIEGETGARISLNQATASLGYSTAQVTGTVHAVEAAKARIVGCLERVGGVPLATASAPATTCTTELQIEQQWVGWLLGKGGSVMKEIEAATGARVVINQETKSLGYSVAQVTGDSMQVAKVQDLIDEKIRRVNPTGSGLSHAPPAATAHALPAPSAAAAALDVQSLAQQLVSAIGRATTQPGIQREVQPAIDGLLDTLAKSGVHLNGRPSPGHIAPMPNPIPVHQPLALHTPQGLSPEEVLELQVEQRWVGWLLGQRGQTMREIEASSGARVTIDQSSKEQGYSTVKIAGNAACVQQAYQRIQASLALVSPMEQPHSGGIDSGLATKLEQDSAVDGDDGDMQVEQQWVGWLLGKGGVVLKEIEHRSGARVSIDQSTKDLGFSTVRIGGGFDQGETARQLIREKLAQASGALQ